MAAFPAWIKYGWRDLADTPESAVKRSDMERGLPKYRRFTSDIMVQLPITLYFQTAQQATDFETWFYSAAGADAGAGYFDFTHPRPGVGMVQARVYEGKIGALKPSMRTWAYAERSMAFEFLRTAL